MDAVYVNTFSLSERMINFLTGTSRVGVVEDMPTISEGFSTIEFIMRLLLTYMYAPLDNTPSLIFNSQRNISNIQKWIDEGIVIEISDSHRVIINAFQEGCAPNASYEDVNDALNAIGIVVNQTTIEVVEDDGSTTNEKVIDSQFCGADEWIISSLGDDMIFLDIDPMNIEVDDLIRIISNNIAPMIEEIPLNELDIFRNVLIPQRDAIVECSDDLLDYDQLNNMLIGETLYEMAVRYKSQISHEPISEPFHRMIQILHDSCKLTDIGIMKWT